MNMLTKRSRLVLATALIVVTTGAAAVANVRMPTFETPDAILGDGWRCWTFLGITSCSHMPGPKLQKTGD